MDQKLEKYIREYVLNIEEICTYLIKELNLRNKMDLIRYRGNINQWEFNVGQVRLCFHGRGCVAEYNDFFYDWDFGYGGRWCGVNPLLLETTLERNGITCWDFKQIRENCEIAITEGKMYKKDGLYYFSIMESDLIKPDFPQVFDKLLIDYFGETYEIKRNKVIDRFLRKSNRVYKDIEKYYDKYTLRFFSDGEEVFVFYYSDVGYPEKAIDLMKSILAESVLV